MEPWTRMRILLGKILGLGRARLKNGWQGPTGQGQSEGNLVVWLKDLPWLVGMESYAQ